MPNEEKFPRISLFRFAATTNPDNRHRKHNQFDLPHASSSRSAWVRGVEISSSW